jgi:1-acyl-sn-glycerol-3-phosphate acyltransferase
MKLQIADTKNALTYAFWSTINKIVLGIKFKNIEIRGLENLPKTGGFMLVSNHSSRWDGLLVYDLINKPANFLVHPNELKGFQGTVLKSMGAFPASTQFDLQTHIERQLSKGEAVVIFPEGDVYRDGQTHAFKSGAARFALNAVRQGVDLPVIPVAIKYADDTKSVCVTVGDAVEVKEYAAEFKQEATLTVRALTSRLYREICHMRLALGATKEAVNLFNTKPNRDFAHTA